MESDDDNIDFEEQLRLEKEEAEKKLSQNSNVKIDPDGTTYEWDKNLEAWFPKVDEDFIAKYQMSYGINPPGDESQTTTSEELEELRKTREQQWKEYYDKCQELQQQSQNENNSGESNDQEQQLYEYYNSDAYREWYSKYVASHQTEIKSAPENEVIDISNSNSKTSENDNTQSEQDSQPAKRKRKVESKPAWYELSDDKNTHVYVQNLPVDITDEEFVELMSKCGMLMYEPFSNKPRAKLYRDEEGNVKGDGRCCYIKIESVDLALQIIDGAQLRGQTISVSKAEFQLKGDFDPQKRRKLTNKEKKKIKMHQENLFRWGPDKSRFDRAKREKALVIKNIFTIEMLDADPLKLPEIKDRLTSEASNCGLVKRVLVHDNHPEGVATIWFSAAEEADTALVYFNKSIFYNGRVLQAEVWDGKTKYDIKESEEEQSKRLESWENYLEGAPANLPTEQNVPSDESAPSHLHVEDNSHNEKTEDSPDEEEDEANGDDSQNYSTDSEFYEGDSDSDDQNG